LEAKIQLSYKSAREAEAIADAVAPDNAKVPQGLKIETAQKGNMVVTHIKCGTRLQTFMATIDDLLESISVAENVFKAAKSQSK
jgi:tRNA threonylcarbamoyladenosine modification (KEOPS) complex  Pcc1 subunit